MKKRQFIAGFAASAIAAGMMALPASATVQVAGSGNSYAAVSPSSVAFDKYLVMKNTANTPAATFSFTVAPGTAVPATAAGEVEVYAGVGTVTIADVVFTAGQTQYAAAQTGDTVHLETGEVYSVSAINVSFGNDVSFNEPGVYRYTVTETATTGAFSVDGTRIKTLDVYVEDDPDHPGTLKVSNYVLYNGVPTTSYQNDSDGKSDSNDSKKVAGFQNAYATEDLTFSKTVTGNQGSKDKYFKFTLTIENAGNGTIMDVIGGGETFTLAPTQTAATEYTAAVMTAANSVDQNTTKAGQQIVAGTTGTVTQTFYLMHGQSVKIEGLPKGAKYTIAELNEDYTPSTVVTGDTTNETEDDIAASDTASVTDASIEADTTVTFTNNKVGTIPTGVLLSVAAPAVVGAGVLGLIVSLTVKRKKRENEE